MREPIGGPTDEQNHMVPRAKYLLEVVRPNEDARATDDLLQVVGYVSSGYLSDESPVRI